MLRGARIAVVVPAYNEERLILPTLRGIPAFVDRIYVVDDASCDRTPERLRRHVDSRLEVLRHPANAGVGAAIATGYRRALAEGADAVAVMAGDGQMHPGDLEALLTPVLRGEADYTKGDRLSHPRVRRRMPRTRRLGNRVLSLATRWAIRLPVRDSQCGYTVISRRALQRLPLAQLWPRYGYPNDLLGYLAERGARIQDVTVRPVYGTERSGVGWRHALWVVPYVLLRVWLRRVRHERLPAPVAAEPVAAEPKAQGR